MKQTVGESRRVFVLCEPLTNTAKVDATTGHRRHSKSAKSRSHLQCMTSAIAPRPTLQRTVASTLTQSTTKPGTTDEWKSSAAPVTGFSLTSTLAQPCKRRLG